MLDIAGEAIAMAGEAVHGAKEAGEKLEGAVRKTVQDPKGSAEEAARKAREVTAAVHDMAAELRAELAHGGPRGNAESGRKALLQIAGFLCMAYTLVGARHCAQSF